MMSKQRSLVASNKIPYSIVIVAFSLRTREREVKKKAWNMQALLLLETNRIICM